MGAEVGGGRTGRSAGARFAGSHRLPKWNGPENVGLSPRLIVLQLVGNAAQRELYDRRGLYPILIFANRLLSILPSRNGPIL